MAANQAGKPTNAMPENLEFYAPRKSYESCEIVQSLNFSASRIFSGGETELMKKHWAIDFPSGFVTLKKDNISLPTLSEIISSMINPCTLSVRVKLDLIPQLPGHTQKTMVTPLPLLSMLITLKDLFRNWPTRLWMLKNLLVIKLHHHSRFVTQSFATLNIARLLKIWL